MALYDSFDESKIAVLNPGDVKKPVGDFPETVIITFSKRVEEIFIEQYGGKVCGELYGGTPLSIYSGEYKGRKVGLFLTYMGAPITVAFMEELIAMGAKKFVVFGSCGVLDDAIEPGHIIVPREAYRDEGTSYHYEAANDFIEIPTADRLAEILAGLKIPTEKCRIWTTDGLYRETKKNMKARKEQGCCAVDMECSAIMAMAKFRGVEAYQFVYAEDSLDGIKWEARTMGRVPREAMAAYLLMSLEVANEI